MLAIYEDEELYTTWMSPFRLNDQIVRLNFGALFLIQEKSAKCKQISLQWSESEKTCRIWPFVAFSIETMCSSAVTSA